MKYVFKFAVDYKSIKCVLNYVRNDKWDMIEDSLDLSIMGSLWSVLSKRKWGFERQS